MATKEKETEAASNIDERSKALKLAIEKIEKDFGKGSIMKLGDKATVNVDAIPTGSLALDVALGIGGVPRSHLPRHVLSRCHCPKRRLETFLRSLSGSIRNLPAVLSAE